MKIRDGRATVSGSRLLSPHCVGRRRADGGDPPVRILKRTTLYRSLARRLALSVRSSIHDPRGSHCPPTLKSGRGVLASREQAALRALPEMPMLLAQPDHALHGFPPYPKEPVAAVPMPSCRVYYPRYYNLTLEQRAYYIYWRQEYERNQLPRADATYRFLYAYELAQRAETAEQLEALWDALRSAYARRDPITRTLSSWIVDLRLQQDRFVYDAVTESIFDHWLMLDIAMAAGVPPHAPVLLPLYSKRTSLPTAVANALLERAALLEKIDTSPVLEAAAGITPSAILRELFVNVGEARSALARFGPLSTRISSFRRSSAVAGAIDAVRGRTDPTE